MRKLAITIASALAALLMALALPCVAGETLTNDHIKKLVAAGVGTDTIVELIRSSPKLDFDTSVSGLIDLKKAGIPDTVVKAMLQPPSARDESTTNTGASKAPPKPHAKKPDMIALKRKCRELWYDSICSGSLSGMAFPNALIWKTAESKGSYKSSMFIERDGVSWGAYGDVVHETPWESMTGLCIDRGPLRTLFYLDTETEDKVVLFGFPSHEKHITTFVREVFELAEVPRTTSCE